MSTWLALYFGLKPGHEEAVKEIFRNSGRPDHEVKDENGQVVGRLLRTIIFVGQEKAVRVIEVEGDMMQVSRHMSRQDEVREVEDALDEHLAEPRNVRTPEGAMAFFMKAGMEMIIHRTDQD